MKRKIIIILLFSLSAVIASAQNLSKDSVVKLRNYIQAKLKEDNVPGLAIAVIRNDSILLMGGYGMADKEKNVPATEHTAWPVGSVSKTLTMAALSKLLNDRHIKLDDPVNKYLTKKISSGKYPSDSITIRRVASHTAGFSRYTYSCYADESTPCLTLSQILSTFAKPVRPAGEIYEYSDLGYGILAQLIADISGKSYSSYMAGMFSRLYMYNSFIDTGYNKSGNAAISYGPSGTRIPSYYVPTMGDAAAYCSVHDLAMFVMNYLNTLNSTAPPNPLFDEMQVPQVQRAPGYSYGLAFHIYENYGGYRVLVHHGHNGLATSVFFLVPEANLCIVACTNTSNLLPSDVAHQLFQWLLPRFDKKALIAESAKWETPSQPFKMDSSYLGNWRGTVSIDTIQQPITMSFQPDGDIQVQIGRQYRTLLNGVRVEDGCLRGSFRSDIPSVIKDYPYNLHIKLKLRSNRTLDGSLTSSSYGTERTNILTFPLQLEKQ